MTTVCPPPQVAIKSIRKDRIKDEQDLIHIRREIEIMSSLNHPHIIAVHEGEPPPHCPFSFRPLSLFYPIGAHCGESMAGGTSKLQSNGTLCSLRREQDLLLPSFPFPGA